MTKPVDFFIDELQGNKYLICDGKELLFYHACNFSYTRLHPLVRKSLTLIAKNVKSPLIDSVFHGKHGS